MTHVNRRTVLGATAAGAAALAGCTEVAVRNEAVTNEFYTGRFSADRNSIERLRIENTDSTKVEIVRLEQRVTGKVQYRMRRPPGRRDPTEERTDRLLWGLFLEANLHDYRWEAVRDPLASRVPFFEAIANTSITEIDSHLTGLMADVDAATNDVFETVLGSEYLPDEPRVVEWFESFIETAESLGVVDLPTDEWETLKRLIGYIRESLLELDEIAPRYLPSADRLGVMNTFTVFDYVADENTDVDIFELPAVVHGGSFDVVQPARPFRERIADYMHPLHRIQQTFGDVRDLGLDASALDFGPLTAIAAALSVAAGIANEAVRRLTRPLIDAWERVETINERMFGDFRAMELQFWTWLDDGYEDVPFVHAPS